jgi:hypothetical protein
MLITASLAAAVAIASTLAAASTASPLPPLVITVTETTEMPPRLMPRVLDEAAAIWNTVGVSFVWRRMTPHAAARMDQVPATTTSLRIVIGTARGTGRENRIPLGWIQFDEDGPAREVYVSYRNAVEYLNGSEGVVGIVSRMTMLEREVYLARAMGRALAHELGHYLLASKEHTRRGLMQGTHTASDFFDPQRRAFGIDPAQRQFVVARLRHDGIVVSR